MSDQPFQPGPGANFLQKLRGAFQTSKDFSLQALAGMRRGGREMRGPLNAIFGDRLAAMGSPLALPMLLYRHLETRGLTADAPARAPKPHRPPEAAEDSAKQVRANAREAVDDDPSILFAPMALHTPALLEFLQQSSAGVTDRLCIFVHGLGSSERTWLVRRRANGTRCYAELLARDTQHAALFLRYNTGKHISENGRELADLLEELYQAWPDKLRELNLIGHSMGGLVVRSATHYGAQAGHAWTKSLRRTFLLGSPLLGAHQEQNGKLTTDVLDIFPLPATKITAGVIDLRSNGIQDLGYGYLRDEDWQPSSDLSAKGALPNRRNPVPLHKGTRYHLILGSLSKDPDSILGSFLGDGVVHRRSAQGSSPADARYENYENAAVHEIRGLNHTRIPGDPRVYRRLRDWLRNGS